LVHFQSRESPVLGIGLLAIVVASRLAQDSNGFLRTPFRQWDLFESALLLLGTGYVSGADNDGLGLFSADDSVSRSPRQFVCEGRSDASGFIRDAVRPAEAIVNPALYSLSQQPMQHKDCPD
jgi:hypothetical protein